DRNGPGDGDRPQVIGRVVHDVLLRSALRGTVRIPAAAKRHPKVRAGWNVAARGPVTRRWYRAGREAVAGDGAQLPGSRWGLGAVGGAELAQEVGDVLFDRVQRHDQVAGDALV